jgi:glycosyltransferase involved in cell wall biosynthesis/uncharacterized membrane protein YbhN (UPF0104 family)
MTHTRLRVLHCCYDDIDNPWVGGGGARRSREIYAAIANDVDVTLATGAFPGACDIIADGITIRRLGSARGYLTSRLTYALAASELLRRAPFDVAVVDHSAYAPVVIPRDRPVGMIVHHLTGPHAAKRWGRVGGWLLSQMEQRLVRRARVFSATSTATEHALRAVTHGEATVVPVSSGVPDELFEIPRHDAGYALYLGRLDSTQKGVDLLLDALAVVVRTLPSARLIVAGRGPDARALEQRVTDLGLAGNVEFRGGVDDATRATLLAGAACQVVPSRFEGFGIVAAEALAARVPLVVTDVPSLVEIVSAVPTRSVVVPSGDAHALAAALVNVLAGADLRRAMADASGKAAERFRWSAVSRDHLAFLKRVASEAHDAPRTARSFVTMRTVKIAVAVLMAVASLAFMGRSLSRSTQSLTSVLATMHYGSFFAGVMLAGVSLTAGCMVWWYLLDTLAPGTIPPLQHLRVWALTNPARYVPGRIWHVTSLAAAMQARNVPLGSLLASVAIHLWMSILAACVLSASVLTHGRSAPVRFALSAIALTGAILGCHPVVLRAVAFVFRRREGRTPSISWATMLAIGVADVGTYVVTGLASWLMLTATVGVERASVWQLVPANAASYLAGYVSLVPAGLGVRESVLTVLLQPLLPVGSAAVGAVVLRIGTTLAELLLFATAAGTLLSQRAGRIGH